MNILQETLIEKLIVKITLKDDKFEKVFKRSRKVRHSKKLLNKSSLSSRSEGTQWEHFWCSLGAKSCFAPPLRVLIGVY